MNGIFEGRFTIHSYCGNRFWNWCIRVSLKWNHPHSNQLTEISFFLDMELPQDYWSQEPSQELRFSILATMQMIRRHQPQFFSAMMESSLLLEQQHCRDMLKCWMMRKQVCFSRPISYIYCTWTRWLSHWMVENYLWWKSFLRVCATYLKKL